jgi:hypothetical protein
MQYYTVEWSESGDICVVSDDGAVLSAPRSHRSDTFAAAELSGVGRPGVASAPREISFSEAPKCYKGFFGFAAGRDQRTDYRHQAF